MRFVVAGLIASVVTFLLLFLMRYLIMGYENSATDSITRYFTLETINLSENEEKRTVRVERPSDRPELTEFDEPDFKQESRAFLDKQSADIPISQLPQQLIEKDLELPQLQAAPLSTKEKLQQIKQGILAEEN